MKTPEEIKKGLECCVNGERKACPYPSLRVDCSDILLFDARECIQWLEEKYARAMENAKILSDTVTRLERELDAAVEMMRGASNCCIFCKHFDMNHYVCKSKAKNDASCWEWRGLCAENGGAKDEN